MKYLLISLSTLLILSCGTEVSDTYTASDTSTVSNAPVDTFLHFVEKNSESVYLSGIVGFEGEISEVTNWSRFVVWITSDNTVFLALERKPTVEWLLDVKEMDPDNFNYLISENGPVKCSIQMGSLGEADPLELSHEIVMSLRDRGYHVEGLEVE